LGYFGQRIYRYKNKFFRHAKEMRTQKDIIIEERYKKIWRKSYAVFVNVANTHDSVGKPKYMGCIEKRKKVW
jgi:hypothetical protein